MADDGNDETKAKFGVADAVQLCVLPFLGQSMEAYAFAGLPLHYRNNGWSLVHFGAVLTGSNLFRTFGPSAMIAYYGPWMTAPLSFFSSCLSLPMVIFPDSEWAVSLGVIGFAGVGFMDAHQAMVSNRFSANEATMTLASRYVTLSGTVGYSLASVVGAWFWDLGGWRACAIFQLIAWVLQWVLYSTSPWTHDEYSKRRKELATDGDHSNSTDKKRLSEFDVAPLTVLGTPKKEPFVPPDLLLPTIVLALAIGTSYFCYATEWTLYAVYFYDVFGWEDALRAGIAQAAGDILGAVALVMVPKCSSIFGGTGSSDCFLTRFVTAPYNNAALLASWVVLHLLMSGSDLVVAVTSQVIMGTAFVFQYQFVVETLQIYANGDERIFLNMQYGITCAFNLGYAAAAVFCLWAYEHLGPQVPFQIAAGFAGFSFVVYTLYFMMRVGFPKSLKDFEEQRAQRNGTLQIKVQAKPEVELQGANEGGVAPEVFGAENKTWALSQQMMNAPVTLFTRVNELLVDCGLAAQSNNENVVSRSRRLASELGIESASVLAVVQEAEVLMYGSLRTGTTARAGGSRVLPVTPSSGNIASNI